MVIDDDDLLRSTLEQADNLSLRRARLINHRIREYATRVIHGRMRDFPVPNDARELFTKMRAFNIFLRSKLDSACSNGMFERECNELVEFQQDDLQSVRKWQLPLYMNALVSMGNSLAQTTRYSQTVITIAMLRSQGAMGPHFILAPTAALPAWQLAFQTVAPGIPLIVNEGSPVERSEKLAAQSQLNNASCDCVWLSSYTLALKDRRNITKFVKGSEMRPKSLTADEGHVELRRGWKVGSPSFELYEMLKPSFGGIGGVEFLSSLSSWRDLDKDALAWFLCRCFEWSGLAENFDLAESAFRVAMREFGVPDWRSAPFVDPWMVNTLGSLIDFRIRSPVAATPGAGGSN